MRAGFSPELERLLRRADPIARRFVEVTAIDREASVRTKEQWAEGTLSGVTAVDDGGIRVSGSVATLVQSTTSPGYLTDLSGTTFAAVMLRLAGTESTKLLLHRFKAYLHPRLNGANPQEVAVWKCQAFAVVECGRRNSSTVDLAPLGDAIYVDATSSAGLVTFDFSAHPLLAKLHRPILPRHSMGAQVWVALGYAVPVVFFVLSALKADGQPAGNMGLGYDTGSDYVESGGNRISTRWLTRVFLPSFLGNVISDGGTAGGAPRCAIETGVYTSGSAMFTSGHEPPSARLNFGFDVSDGILMVQGAFSIPTHCPVPIFYPDWRWVPLRLPSGRAPSAGGNALDLGGTPTGTVEFLAQAEVPEGSSATFSVSDDGGSTWTPYVDGQTSDDLSLAKQQTYAFKVELASASGEQTPLVHAIGVRELARVSLDGLCAIEGPQWAVDVRTGKAEIGEVRIRALRDGMQDFADAVTELLLAHDPVALTFETVWGHPSLARSKWLREEVFLLDDVVPSDAAIEIVGLTPLAALKQALPRPQFLTVSGVSLTFAAKVAPSGPGGIIPGEPAKITRASGSWLSGGFQAADTIYVTTSASNDGNYYVAEVSATVLELGENDNLVAEGPTSAPTIAATIRRPYQKLDDLKAVTDDLLDAQLALPGRYRGPGIQNATDVVANSITDSDAKAELYALAWIAGGFFGSQQGRVRYVDLFGPKEVVAYFPRAEIQVEATLPGFGQRIPELYIRYDWDEARGDYRAEARAYNVAALSALGGAYIAPTSFDDRASRWLHDDTLAQTIADRIVRFQGAGILHWAWTSIYAYPELEPGDMVAVETTGFVARDPFSGVGIRGHTWALVVLTNVQGGGRRFAGWVRSYQDILPSIATLLRDPLAKPNVEAYFTPVGHSPGQVTVRLAGPPNAIIFYLIQDWPSETPAPGVAAWITYAGPFVLTQLESLDRQLSVYASVVGILSPIRTWRLDKDTIPEVVVTLSEPVAGTVRVSITPDDDVVQWKLYLGTNLSGNGWPTLNQNSDGILDEARLIGTIAVVQDGGSWDRLGSPLAGVLDAAGTARTGIGGTRYHHAGFSGSDIVKVIALPLDWRGLVGARATGAITVNGGAAGPALTAFSASLTDGGTSCGDPATATVSWSVNGAVSDGNHDLRIYRTYRGNRQLVTTIATPVTTSSYLDELDNFEDTGSGVWYHYVYDYELITTTPTVIDSGSAPALNVEMNAEVCPS